MATELGELTEQVAELLDTITNLDVVDVPQQVDGLAAQVADLRADVAALAQAVGGLVGVPGSPPPDHSAEIAQIQQQLAAIGSQIAGLQTADSGLAGDIAALSGRVDAVEQAPAPAVPIVWHGLDVNQAVVTGSTDETALYACYQPPNQWQMGDEFRLQMAGTVVGTEGTKTISVRLNGVQLYAFAISRTLIPSWRLQLQILMRSAVEAVFVVELAYYSSRMVHQVKTIAIDLSADNTLSVSGKLSDAADTLTLEMAKAETVSHPPR